jgi:hypothetical protein
MIDIEKLPEFKYNTIKHTRVRRVVLTLKVIDADALAGTRKDVRLDLALPWGYEGIIDINNTDPAKLDKITKELAVKLCDSMKNQIINNT